jgi:ElaA protein
VTGSDEYDVQVAAFAELDARTGYLLWQLREAVFVVEQHCPYPELDGHDLEPGTRHLWISSDGRPIGYLRVLDDGSHARIGRVCVAASHRGRGLAGTLMRAALEVTGDRPSRLSAQSYLVGWYRRLGYATDGAEFLEDGIAHVPMVRPGSAAGR